MGFLFLFYLAIGQGAWQCLGNSTVINHLPRGEVLLLSSGVETLLLYVYVICRFEGEKGDGGLCIHIRYHQSVALPFHPPRLTRFVILPNMGDLQQDVHT